jgi:hypothetical protein
MSPDPISLAEMSEFQKKKYFPNLTKDNFHKTSEETIDYNCVAWVHGRQDEPIDLSMDDEGEPIPGFDTSITPYIDYFKKFEFNQCEDGNLVEGIEKIALYEGRENYFEHVARQLENGNWTSKIGEFEDIEHYTLEALSNPTNYGQVVFFMERKRK